MCLVIYTGLWIPARSPFEYLRSRFLCVRLVVFAEAPFDDLFQVLFIVGAGMIIMLRERREIGKTETRDGVEDGGDND